MLRHLNKELHAELLAEAQEEANAKKEQTPDDMLNALDAFR